MQGKFASSAAAILVGALFVAGEVAAQTPIWDPLDPNTRVPVFSPSRVCQIPVTSTTWVTVVAGPRDGSNNPTGIFPETVACPSSPSSTCLQWGYKFFYPAGVNPSLVLLAADSNVKVISAPGLTQITYPFHTSTTNLSKWDSSIGWGNTSTELGLRFSDNASTYSASIYTDTNARPGTVTVGYKSGKLGGFCAILGAHMALPGDQFQPAFQAQTVVVAGGKCNVTLVFDASNNVTDVINPTPIPPYTGVCTTNTHNNPVLVNGAPLKNNSGPHGITFGTGTTTCYGPPRPSIPKCVCTAAPCP